LITYLAEAVGVNGTFAILGGISVGTILCSSLMRPLAVEIVDPHRDEGHSGNAELSDQTQFEQAKSSCVVEGLPTESGHHKILAVLSIISEILGLKLMKNKTMMVTVVAYFIVQLALGANYIYLLVLMEDEGHVSEVTASWAMSAMGASNAIGRICFGALGDLMIVRPYWLVALSFLCSGISTFVFPLKDTLAFYITNLLFYGFVSGGCTSLQAVALVDLFGIDQLASATGLVYLFKGFGEIVGPPMFGELEEIAHSYAIMFYASSGCFALGAAICCLIRRYQDKQQIFWISNTT